MDRVLDRRRPDIALVLSGVLWAIAVVVRWWQPDVLAAATLVPPWLWLVPAMGLTWFGRKSRWMWLVWSVVVCWTAFAALAIEEPRPLVRSLLSPVPEPAAGEKRVRVVTLNCGDGGTRSAEALVALEADVVLLQEAP